MVRKALNFLVDGFSGRSDLRISKILRRLEQIELRLNLVAGCTGSNSQYFQDLFVLSHTGYKQGGFFVDFGATNGLEGNNTMLLEKQYGWNGILVEPARVWHGELEKNRHCVIDRRCVWKETGKIIEFWETDAAVLSTAKEFAQSDLHHRSRLQPKDSYTVETVSLNDLLTEHKAPKHIDYLSIDTEGSEFAILEAFDFSARTFEVITCEHNFSDNRDKIRGLLSNHGYKLLADGLTDCDDWFVLNKNNH